MINGFINAQNINGKIGKFSVNNDFTTKKLEKINIEIRCVICIL